MESESQVNTLLVTQQPNESFLPVDKVGLRELEEEELLHNEE